jgi:anaerobic magnesium-protoporphyrin IX monomethyl ester cyclase
MRTLLAYTAGPELADDYFARKIPVGLGILNAVLNEAGFPSRVGNLSRFDEERTVGMLERERPDVLGLSVFTFNRHPSQELAKLAKRVLPGVTIVAGGPHVTHLDGSWLDAYPEFDAVVRGEGEDTMLEIVRRRAAGESLSGIPGTTTRDHRAPDRPAIQDLDRLPHNADHLARSIGVDVPDQLRYFISSRGCPGACTFCNTPDFWGRRVRFRSVEDVLGELRTLRARHGLVHVSFRDDTFTAHRPRTIELCRRLIDEGPAFLWDCQSRVNLVDEERLRWMKRAGCHHVQYGIESGSERILKLLQKDITLDQIRHAVALTRAAGLVVSIYLISGVPEETEEDIQATLALIREILPHDGIVAPLAVYPGTKLYEDSKRFLGVGDDVWVNDPRAALWVREDEVAQRHYRMLTTELQRTGKRAAYGPADFDRFDRELGFCFTTAMQRSEYHRGRGEMDRALAAAEEIVRRAPENPWGPLRLAELHAESGAPQEASAMRARARALVPRLVA